MLLWNIALKHGCFILSNPCFPNILFPIISSFAFSIYMSCWRDYNRRRRHKSRMHRLRRGEWMSSFSFLSQSFFLAVYLVYREVKSWWEGPSGCGSPFPVFELLRSDCVACRNLPRIKEKKKRMGWGQSALTDTEVVQGQGKMDRSNYLSDNYLLDPWNVSWKCYQILLIFLCWLLYSTCYIPDVTAVAAGSVCWASPPAQPAVPAASLFPFPIASSAAAAGASSPPSPHAPAEARSGLPWPLSEWHLHCGVGLISLISLIQFIFFTS